MTPYAQLPTNTPEEFMRTVGLSKEYFQHLNRKLADYLDEQNVLNPLSRRGRKDSKLALEVARYWRFTTSATIRPSSIWGRSSASASPIAIRFIPAPQDCWPKSKSCPTVRSCWKTRQQRWLLTSRSNLSNARSRTKKRTTQEKNATRSRPSSWSAHWRWLSSRWRWAKADNTIFRLLLHPDARLLADSGYQRMHKYHQNSTLPIKKKKGQSLSAEDKAHNKALSKQRVFIEHVNRRCKIFRIVKEVYRGKHKNYSLTWRLVAALVNLRYGCIRKNVYWVNSSCAGVNSGRCGCCLFRRRWIGQRGMAEHTQRIWLIMFAVAVKIRCSTKKAIAFNLMIFVLDVAAILFVFIILNLRISLTHGLIRCVVGCKVCRAFILGYSFWDSGRSTLLIS